MARRLLISKISTLRFASFFTQNAHYRNYRSHLTGFKVLIAISSAFVVSLGAVLATLTGRGSVDKSIVPQGLSNIRRLSTLNPMSLYPVPYSLTVGTVTGIIVTFLTFLRLTGFLLAFYISLEHGLHEGHALIVPRLLVGLLELRGLTCCCLDGLTIAVIATSVQGVVGLEGTAVGFAMLTELFFATLLRDSTSQAPRCLALHVTLGFGWGCIALSFALSFPPCFSIMTHSMASRSGSNVQVD